MYLSKVQARARRVLAATAVLMFAITVAHAQPEQDWIRTEVRDDCLSYNPLRTPLFGETHVHTSYSGDARILKLRTTPRDSYAFAKGAAQDLPPYDVLDVATRSYQMNRPLDWMAVSDHAEQFGETQICFDNSFTGYTTSLCVDLRDQIALPPAPPGPLPPIFATFLLPLSAEDPVRFTQVCGASNADCLSEASFIWQDTQDAAEENYDRSDACTFTSFVAYEWTSQTGGDNIHRNVIFRNAEVQGIPTSAYETTDDAVFRDTLDAECTNLAGNCELIAIPHNGNTSRGLMWQTTLRDGSPMTLAYAEQRARLEPIVEMFQSKGNSECKFGFPSTDEDCRFESMGRAQNFATYNPNQVFQPLSFVREALKEGFALEADLGVNPFKFGFIGSTDGHSNLPGAVSEEDYSQAGHFGASSTQNEWALENENTNGIEANPGGLAVVYAEENSRDAIFAAMKRRETYATSGPRIVARMFAGRMPKDLCDDVGFTTEGYSRGVPMGGEIGPVKGKKSPRFAILANKDPGGNGDPSVPLQRIEVVKAWVDGSGVRQEKVFLAAGTKADKSDAGVDLSTCAPQGTDGFDSLCAVWSDPSFKASENAAYYARVTQNPTCRWHQYTCNEHAASYDCSDPFSVPISFRNCCDNFSDWPRTIQERAWTSPIFYEPGRAGVGKAILKYGKNGGDDKLKLSATIGRLPATFDVSVDALTVTLRDDDAFFNVTIPAGTLIPVGNGTKFKYKDSTGALGGIKTALLKTSTTKQSELKITTVKMDLSAAEANNHDVEFEIASGSYQSIDKTPWEYDGKSLRIPK